MVLGWFEVSGKDLSSVEWTHASPIAVFGVCEDSCKQMCQVWVGLLACCGKLWTTSNYAGKLGSKIKIVWWTTHVANWKGTRNSACGSQVLLPSPKKTPRRVFAGHCCQRAAPSEGLEPASTWAAACEKVMVHVCNYTIHICFFKVRELSLQIDQKNHCAKIGGSSFRTISTTTNKSSSQVPARSGWVPPAELPARSRPVEPPRHQSPSPNQDTMQLSQGQLSLSPFTWNFRMKSKTWPDPIPTWHNLDAFPFDLLVSNPMTRRIGPFRPNQVAASGPRTGSGDSNLNRNGAHFFGPEMISLVWELYCLIKPQTFRNVLKGNLKLWFQPKHSCWFVYSSPHFGWIVQSCDLPSRVSCWHPGNGSFRGNRSTNSIDVKYT